MNVAPEYLMAIQRYGYTRTEAGFLYLVATHSGYFTQRQFLYFARVENGGTARRFTEKLLRFRHGRTTRYGYRTLIYNLGSRSLYANLNKDNLRNRRRLSNDLIRTRLLILDFVLDHLEHLYFETAADKVAYFHRKLRVPLPVLPGRIYRGIQSTASSKRYFVDRFPIFIPGGPESLFLALPPTFVYCDSTKPGLLRYIGHLRTYEPLLNQLPSFNFVYAAPNDTKFEQAGKFFSRLFSSESSSDTDRLIRYFKIRKLWEEHKTSGLTRPDRQLLRYGDQRFHSHIFEDAYRQWSTAQLSRTDLSDALRRAKAEESRLFSTCVLRDDYDIFERLSKDYPVDQAGTISRNRGFVRRIVMPLLRPPDPKVPTRKVYVRIDEPLAITLDRYAQFLGTTGIDHIVNQALELVFRKDTDFKEWLARHPEPAALRGDLGTKKPITVAPQHHDGSDGESRRGL
jgi:hypothetical protein